MRSRQWNDLWIRRGKPACAHAGLGFTACNTIRCSGAEPAASRGRRPTTSVRAGPGPVGSLLAQARPLPAGHGAVVRTAQARRAIPGPPSRPRTSMHGKLPWSGSSRQPGIDMRLLILEPDPRHGGGSEAVMLSLGRELAGRGHDLALLHETSGSMLADYQGFCRDVVRRPLPGFALRQPRQTLGCVRTIGRVARELDINAVLSSHLGFLRHAALVRRVYGIPFCFHLGLPWEGRQLSIRLALGSAGAGVAPSAHTLESWRRGGWPADALHEVRNWVDTAVPSLATCRSSPELWDAGRPVCLVFVGRVWRRMCGRLLDASRRCPQGHITCSVGPSHRTMPPACAAGALTARRARITLCRDGTPQRLGRGRPVAPIAGRRGFV